jgi:hypothetical protein
MEPAASPKKFDYLVNYSIVTFVNNKLIMTLSFIFSFAPLPLTDEFSPLAHAASLARRRQLDGQFAGVTRHRIQPMGQKTPAEASLS